MGRGEERDIERKRRGGGGGRGGDRNSVKGLLPYCIRAIFQIRAYLSSVCRPRFVKTLTLVWDVVVIFLIVMANQVQPESDAACISMFSNGHRLDGGLQAELTRNSPFGLNQRPWLS